MDSPTIDYDHLYTLPIVPKPAVRLNRNSMYGKKREAVIRYMEYKDSIRGEVVKLDIAPEMILPESPWLVFKMPIPKSRSALAAAEAIDQPHLQTPDIDNLLKAVLDSLFGSRMAIKSDSHIWDVRMTKIWAKGEGAIEIWRMPSYHEIMSYVENPWPTN